MIRSIKALGLALLAIAAIGAFAAASAQAAAGEVHITTEKRAVITGHGENENLTINGSPSVTCKTGTFEGTLEQAEAGSQVTAKEITVTAAYSGCEYIALKAGAQVRMNGCKYTLRGTVELTAQAQVSGCTSGKTIEIIAAGGLCTLTIGEQGELKHVTFTNNAESETTKHHLQDHATVEGITYTRDGAFCPQGTAGYEGTTTIKAYKDLKTEEVQDPVTGHKYIKHLCGEEVGILGT